MPELTRSECEVGGIKYALVFLSPRRIYQIVRERFASSNLAPAWSPYSEEASDRCCVLSINCSQESFQQPLAVEGIHLRGRKADVNTRRIPEMRFHIFGSPIRRCIGEKSVSQVQRSWLETARIIEVVPGVAGGCWRLGMRGEGDSRVDSAKTIAAAFFQRK